jgi:hypothetical protein
MWNKQVVSLARAFMLIALLALLPAAVMADITVVKEVSVNGGSTWTDANTAPGPVTPLEAFTSPLTRSIGASSTL